MLVPKMPRRVYETTPLAFPRCGAKTKVVSFNDTHQRDMVEKNSCPKRSELCKKGFRVGAGKEYRSVFEASHARRIGGTVTRQRPSGERLPRS